MAKKLHASRYTEAVFEIAREKGQLDRWQSDLNEILRLMADADVVAVLENPKIRFEQKARLLKERLPDVAQMALNLVYLLIARDRLGIIHEIVSQYQEMLDSYRGVEQAKVITATPLADNERQRLIESLKTITGKEIVMKAEVDPNILGGVIIRVGDRLIDGSTRRRLVALKKELAGARS